MIKFIFFPLDNCFAFLTADLDLLNQVKYCLSSTSTYNARMGLTMMEIVLCLQKIKFII
jgi:hypothetical protein